MIFLLKMNKGAKIQKLKTTKINNFFSFFVGNMRLLSIKLLILPCLSILNFYFVDN